MNFMNTWLLVDDMNYDNVIGLIFDITNSTRIVTFSEQNILSSSSEIKFL